MQQKFRVADDVWQAFCNTLPEDVTPSDKLREMVQGIVSPLDSIIGVEEAAERWNLAPGYIKNLCASGKVKAVKIGKTWVIDKNQGKP
ncbi:helix-turn-helix domain-containing protein [Paenibacillus sp. Soil724D2]|uniref:helix-turn-helix domain-containing protein n=1 Tax=Paenibacillus sp. (strain Soil724D2) TaxID=1736392 RepID=UPI000713BA19|nr:helix-turn-helix domain-containing protein [Paenibacillus sp. Soil724D2]KRE33280.1 hypothetical protein ASG85_13445 [Paenibacillus sp. Soil724D2]